MAKRDRWYFTREELENSPSRKCGIDKEKELSSRQQAANLIQDIGQKLKVTQLVINTAIVYMHRFYTFHSFSKFRRNGISSCALFLAAKVEEQPRKLEHVIKVSQLCIYRENLDIKSEQYQSLAAELVYHENLMLRTLGFDLSVQHPHTSVVNCCHLVRAPKALTQASYFMATNSLHLTNLCLRYKPSVVACICIYFVCKWARFELARSVEGKDWWAYVDPTVNHAMLEELTGELLSIFQKCPSRMKRILDANKLPNSPSLRPIDNDFNKNDLSHKSTFDDPSNKVSPDYQSQPSSESRHKTMPPNLFKDPQFNKKDPTNIDQLSSKSVPKPTIQQSNNNNNKHQSSVLPTAQSKDSESVQLNVSSKNNNLSSDERLKLNSSADNNLQTSFNKTKSNLSVIAPNTLSNNSSSSTNATFNESLIDSHAMFSNDSNDMSELNAAHKKEMLDFKMEFSDNEDSNPSNNNISLTSTLMMNDSNDSKSLSHFSNKSNLDINSQNYDFKIRPNTFSQFPSSISSAKSDTDSQPPVNTNSLLSNSYSKLPLTASSQPNNVLPNVLLNQFSDDSLSDKSGLSLFNSKKSSALSSSHKLSEPFKNVNVSSDSKTISNPSFNSFSDSLDDSLNPNISNILPSTSNYLQSGTRLSHDNGKSLFNQNLASNITQTPNIDSELDETSNHSKHAKQHKEKHKHKDKHKHKHKDKHKHKHKDKDKEKSRDKYNVEQSNFKVLLSPPKTKDESEKPAPIKLKISKQKFSVDEPPDKEADKKPLKLKISLSNHQRSSSESPSNIEPVSKKRKHAPGEKNSKPEKTSKLSNDHNDQFFANSNKSNKRAT